MGAPEQAEKRREHFAFAKAPDWKYTPLKPNRGVPVPYWTIAYFDKAQKTAPSADGRANEYFIARSRAPISNGGEAGKGKGVLTDAYMDEFEPKEWSNTLIIEGDGAVFQGHMGTINKGNAPAKVYTSMNPDQAIADKACWEKLKTNISALGVTSKDRMFADPTGCGKDVLSGAWGTISGDVSAVGDMLSSIWGGITAFFSDPLGSMGSAVDGLKQFGTQAYDAGKQVVEVIQGLRDGSIKMDDLLDFAADMLQDQLCEMADKIEEMIKQGKGCEAIGVLVGQATEAVVIAAATAATGGAAGAAAAAGSGAKFARATEMLGEAGIKAGDGIKAAIEKLKNLKRKRKEAPHGEGGPHRPNEPHTTDSSTPGSVRPSACPLCPTVGKRPVNPVLGVKVLADAMDLDFDLPAPLPLPWQRTYVSNNPHSGWLGQGWALGLSTRLVERRTSRGLGLVLIDEFGRDIDLPWLRPGDDHYNEFEQITLSALDDGRLQLSGNDGAQRLLFAPVAAAGRQLRQFVLVAIRDRNDNLIRIDYDAQGLPARVLDSAGRTLMLSFDHVQPHGTRRAAPRLTRIELLDADGRRHHPLVSYRYDEKGDLVAVTDRLGRISRQFEYRNHMLVAHSHAGVRTQYSYDRESPHGRVLSSESSTGERYEFEYLEDRTRVTDTLGRLEIYEFNKNREWTGVIDALGGHTVRELDAFGNLVGLIDAAGRRTRYINDGRGRPVSIQSPGATALEPIVQSVSYDEGLGLPVRVSDPAGGTTNYRYDTRGNLVERIDALGHVTRFECDSRGLPVGITDALGKTKRMTYNAAGQLTRYTDCSGQSTDYAYDAWGQLQRMTDALGQSTVYEQDPLGRLLAVSYPDGACERFEYDALGRLVAHVDPLGARTEYSLAADGLPTMRRNALGGELRYEYDAARRLRVLFNENQARYDFVHDSLDRLVEEIGFDGRQTLYRYDPTGLVLAKLEPGCLDARQRLAQRTARHQAGGPIPPQRRTPTYEDPWGEGLIDESAPLALPPGHTIATRYKRDEAGRLVQKQVAGNVLDASGRPQPQHRSTRYRYDASGQLVEAVNDAGTRTTLSYDLLGRLVEEGRLGQGVSATLRHQYDPLGNRDQTELPDGRRLNWLFYGSGHLHQINLDARVICDIERDALHRESSRSQGRLSSRYQWDPLGRLTAQSARRQGGAGPVGDVVGTAGVVGSRPQARGAADPREIDPLAAQAPVGAGVLARQYRYDLAGNLLGVEDARRGALRYQYDALGQLQVASQPRLTERFAFDPAHNILTPDAQAQSGNGKTTGLVRDNRLEVFEDKRYRWDSHGNLIEKKIGQHTTIRLLWDVEHQLSEAIVTRGDVRQRISYAYDAFGRRVLKQDAFGQTVFGWDGNRLLSEQRAARHTLYLYEAKGFAPLAQVVSRAGQSPGAPELVELEVRTAVGGDRDGADRNGVERNWPSPAAEEQDWQPRKVRGELSDSMLRAQRRLRAQVRSRESNGESAGHAAAGGDPRASTPPAPLRASRVHYYHNDHLGTPRELSSEEGEIVWGASYRAWGNVLKVEQVARLQGVEPGAQDQAHDDAVEQNLRFQGQYFDPETGLHYNRFRYYDPDAGRFVSQDPVGLTGGVNFFEYAPNPTNWVDPYGLRAIWNTRLMRGMLRNKTKIAHWDRYVFQDDSAFAQSDSNLCGMLKGNAPVGNDGKPINLHHISGEEPGAMLEMQQSIHQKVSKNLHFFIDSSFRNDPDAKKHFEDFKKDYWKTRAKNILRARCK